MGDALARQPFALRVGATIGDVRLVEPIEQGEKVACWRGQRRNGEAVTVHALQATTDRERDTFVKAAARLESLRDRFGLGVVRVVEVWHGGAMYVARVHATGTMADLPVLSWDFERQLAFVKRIGGILEAMHGEQLFHGCLRPQNVLLDEQFEPVLSDVGVLVLEDSFPGTAETRHEYWAYAAREVRQGQAPNGRSDVFSLGRLLYFVLAGEDPDEEDEDLPLLERLRDAPPGLVRIVRKATVRDPAGRYGSVKEMLDDLSRYGQTASVGLSHPRGPEGRRRTPVEAPSVQRAEARASVPPPRAEPRPDVPSMTTPLDAGESNDPLVGNRALVVGLVGVAALGVAAALAYGRGDVDNQVRAVGLVGAALAGQLLPATSRPLLGRPLWAAVAVAAAVFGDPWGYVATKGRVARFTEGTPRERAAAVVSLARRGRTDFSDLELSGADFSGTELAGLDLRGTKLGGAKFVGANLEQARLADADVSDADFSGADLEGSDVDSSAGWRSTTCDDATVMPEGWWCEEGSPRSAGDIDGIR